jgi:hypothetical protein
VEVTASVRQTIFLAYVKVRYGDQTCGRRKLSLMTALVGMAGGGLPGGFSGQAHMGP